MPKIAGVKHLNAVRALEKFGFRIARQGKHIVMTDGKVAPEERGAILSAASAEGIDKGTAAYNLLGKWLDQSPGPDVKNAWIEFVGELAQRLPAASITELKDKVLQRCWCVAKSSGGYLGLGSVSPSEQKAIDELTRAYNKA